MATEYTYLLERQMSHIPKRGKDIVRLKHQGIEGRVTKRDFWPTFDAGKPVYIDVNTGTKYDAATGECLSTPQMRLVLSGDAAVTVKRKDLSAQSYDGWLNDKRRVA